MFFHCQANPAPWKSRLVCISLAVEAKCLGCAVDLIPIGPATLGVQARATVYPSFSWRVVATSWPAAKLARADR